MLGLVLKAYFCQLSEARACSPELPWGEPVLAVCGAHTLCLLVRGFRGPGVQSGGALSWRSSHWSAEGVGRVLSITQGKCQDVDVCVQMVWEGSGDWVGVPAGGDRSWALQGG